MPVNLDAWKEYDESISHYRGREFAPAFAQEDFVGGLWSIQYLVHGLIDKQFDQKYRENNLPPTDWCPTYAAWPGDQRGWMKFQTKEDARDFYKFATNRISMKQYDELNKKKNRKWSGKTIDMDENGDFIEGTEK